LGGSGGRKNDGAEYAAYREAQDTGHDLPKAQMAYNDLLARVS
jgi:hypothetical protein